MAVNQVTLHPDGNEYCIDKLLAAALAAMASGTSSSDDCDITSSTCSDSCKVPYSRSLSEQPSQAVVCCWQSALKIYQDAGCCGISMIESTPAESLQVKQMATRCSMSLPSACECLG